MLKDFDIAIYETKFLTGDFFLRDGDVIDYPFEDYVFENMTLTNGSLSVSNFLRCRFSKVVFDGVGLEYVTFSECHFEATDFIRCCCDGMKLENCKGKPVIK